MKPHLIILVLAIVFGGCTPHLGPREARIRNTFGLTPPYHFDQGRTDVILGANHRRVEYAVRDSAAPDLRLMAVNPPMPMSWRNISLRATRDGEFVRAPIGSTRESTFIDLLTAAAEQQLTPMVVARIDSIHDARSLPGFSDFMGPDQSSQAHNAALAVSVAWGLRRQRRLGYFLPANYPEPQSGAVSSP